MVFFKSANLMVASLLRKILLSFHSSQVRNETACELALPCLRETTGPLGPLGLPKGPPPHLASRTFARAVLMAGNLILSPGASSTPACARQSTPPSSALQAGPAAGIAQTPVPLGFPLGSPSEDTGGDRRAGRGRSQGFSSSPHLPLPHLSFSPLHLSPSLFLPPNL